MLEHQDTQPVNLFNAPAASLRVTASESTAPEASWWPATRSRLARFFRIQLPQHAYLGDRPGWDRQD